MDDDKRDEKLGRTVFSIAWFLYAAKFLAVTTVISGVILYFLHRPLWIAPIIAIIIFSIYRLIWRLTFKLIEWASKQ